MYRAFGKRLFDLAVTVPLILLTAPIMILAAILVKVDSPGPIFFFQERLGYKGKIFRAYKFRTMTDRPRVPDREIRAGDAEVTRFGHYLRRFKIDELPQLFNVLSGEMSIVGPRPALPRQMDEYDAESRRRLDALPGCTGLAQVNGASFLSWPERWVWDVQYVDRMSFPLDLVILFRTVAVVLLGEERFLRRVSEGNQA
jgi:lipopolysaccharide/colanic/teichoic acid biosynthesis glycosyltransferase